MSRARSNLVQAKTLQPGVYLEDLCFQAQQAAEKFLKALLLARDGSFPYTHDLARLLGSISEKAEDAPKQIRQSARLNEYAVEARYPGVSEPVEQEEYEEAVKLAEVVVLWVESRLADNPENAFGRSVKRLEVCSAD